MKQQTRPPYGLYGATLAGLIVARFADLLTAQTDFAAMAYQSTRWWVGLALTAIVTTWFTAQYVRPRVPKAMGLLLCTLVGGATTLLTASYVGMAIGGLVGLFSQFDRPRTFAWRCGSLMGRAMLRLLPALIVGFASGFVAWIVIAQFGLAAGRPLAFGLATVSSGLVVWLAIAVLCRPQRKWYRWIGALGVFATLCLIGFVVGAWQDRLRRQQAVAPRVHVYPSAAWLPGAPPRTLSSWLWPGQALVLGPETTDRDLSHLAGLPVIESIQIGEGSRVTDKGLAALPLNHLADFASFGDGLITEELLARVGAARKLQGLRLTGKQVNDQSLLAIKSQPNLAFLSLRGTQVTSAGFDKFFGAAPPLWYVDLSNTNVDDDVFAPLSRAPKLQSVLMRGTKVTGSGLRHLRGTNIATLDLSQTPLEEKYLADLLPTEEDQPAGVPLGVRTLNLEGVRISAQGIGSLGKMPWLNRLDIPDANVDDAAVKPLSNLTLEHLAIRADKLSPGALRQLGPIRELNLHFDASELDLATICSRAVELIKAHRAKITAVPAQNPDTSVTIRNLALDRQNYDHMIESLSVIRHEVNFEAASLFGGEPANYQDLSELEYAVGKAQSKELSADQTPTE